MDPGVRQTSVYISFLPPNNCMTLGKLHNLFKPGILLEERV